MEEIKVYRSIWKSLPLLVICFANIALFILMLRDKEVGNGILVWLYILFLGLGALILLYDILRERLFGKPTIVVTDTKLVMNIVFRYMEVSFADVKEFYVIKIRRRGFVITRLIGIKYKKGVERSKFDNANKAGRAVRQFNSAFYGSQESIPAAGLTMRPQRLCDLLNERVAASNANVKK